MKIVTLTTGSAISSDGRFHGGWAYILRYGGYFAEDSGGSERATQSRMEIQAVIEGLQKLKGPCEVLLFSDYESFLDEVSHKRFIWKADGWTLRSYLNVVRQWYTYPLDNADLWQQLDAAAEKHIIHTVWTGSYIGMADPYKASRDLVRDFDQVSNDMVRCDQLAHSQSSRCH